MCHSFLRALEPFLLPLVFFHTKVPVAVLFQRITSAVFHSKCREKKLIYANASQTPSAIGLPWLACPRAPC
uniref:Uncharacterized protein n=1 Tax=Arundo donax TaxID=35708 RepID=A0A0A9GDQ1_ARUDO